MKPPVWPKPPFPLTEKEEAVHLAITLEIQQWGYSGFVGKLQNAPHEFIGRRIMKAAESGSPRVLEIGCGSGHFPGILKDAGVDYTGLDLYEEHLACAREKCPQFKFLKSSAYELPFEDAHFDFVVSIYVFEHLANLPVCLDEARRVLKPGGRLLVGLPAEGGFAYGLGRRLTSDRHFSRKYEVDYLRIVRAEHCNTAADVLHELKRRFQVVASRHYPFRVPSIHLAAMLAYECVPVRLP